ncbi:valine--tRNA ligase [Clostridia bacterium]|nr:valine--tRNA ligase [Clostridia bacterium]
MPELPKAYEPKSVEPRIYQQWLDGEYFTADPTRPGEAFTMVMPPPNVTGQLHLGHAFDHTLQDILARYKRMRGYNVLWLPGVDHAGIATQVRVEQALRVEENLTRHELGREKFLQRVWAWKNKYGDRIIEQCKTLGSSCDWSRARFTMDEGFSKAVREVFVRLYEQKLIYKGERIINWCPKCTTALSDAEVVHEESPGHLWHIKYPAENGEFVIVATTRPETMFGDTAVAVHPEDQRYKHLIGKTVTLPLMNRAIPVVADEYVEREFGTGCVKITPSHDPNDFEVAARHNLPHILVLDGNAVVNANGGKYQGLTREAARKAVVKDLEDLGLLVKIENHVHNVGHCDRCKTIVEPIASAQWFVKMKPLAAPAIKVVKDGEVKFVPDNMAKIYFNWLENVRDWCVSRQLWWGHRIPAWHCADCGEYTVSREDAQVCAHCGSANIKQEDDVLDTWFSSALWPFATLGWPENTADLQRYYPNSVLVTGYEIIFLWVARMMFSGLKYLDKPPFSTILIHGIMRDHLGRKMSKSLDNGIDPIEVIDKYGADALRMNIITGVSPGNDTRFFDERCEAMGNFCNKLWNAARFTLLHIGDNQTIGRLRLEDKWILTRLSIAAREVTENLERFDLGIAASKLYEFVWGEFCDWYIELSKTGDSWGVLTFTLKRILTLLHPFMPHITEEIWQSLPRSKGESEALIVEKWFASGTEFPAESAAMERIIEVIRAVRVKRAELKVAPSKKAHMYISTEFEDDFKSGLAYITRLAGASEVELASPDAAGLVVVVTPSAKVYLPLAELVDLNAERERLNRDLSKTEKEREALAAKLSNPGFTDKAPAHVVAKECERLEKLTALVVKLKEGLNELHGG